MPPRETQKKISKSNLCDQIEFRASASFAFENGLFSLNCIFNQEQQALLVSSSAWPAGI